MNLRGRLSRYQISESSTEDAMRLVGDVDNYLQNGESSDNNLFSLRRRLTTLEETALEMGYPLAQRLAVPMLALIQEQHIENEFARNLLRALNGNLWAVLQSREFGVGDDMSKRLVAALELAVEKYLAEDG